MADEHDELARRIAKLEEERKRKYLTIEHRLLGLVDDPETSRQSREELLKVAAKMHNDKAKRRHRRAMEKLKRRSFDVLTSPRPAPGPPLGQVAQEALDEFFEQQAKNGKAN